MIKVVLVDDFMETIESLSMIYMLQRHINIVGSANNSEQLWGILSEREVDIVSLDIELGYENGLEICKMLHEKYPDIFVVMCSVEATVLNRKLANEAGASHFLAKPITQKDVTQTMRMFSSRGQCSNKSSTALTEGELDRLLDEF